MAEGEGFEPSVPVSQYTGLANQRLKPLGHPSWGYVGAGAPWPGPPSLSTAFGLARPMEFAPMRGQKTP